MLLARVDLNHGTEIDYVHNICHMNCEKVNQMEINYHKIHERAAQLRDCQWPLNLNIIPLYITELATLTTPVSFFSFARRFVGLRTALAFVIQSTYSYKHQSITTVTHTLMHIVCACSMVTMKNN